MTTRKTRICRACGLRFVVPLDYPNSTICETCWNEGHEDDKAEVRQGKMKPTEDDVVKQMAADIHEHLREGGEIIAALSKQVHEQEQELTELRKDKERLDWLEKMVVEVRLPLVYGSRELFIAAPGHEEDNHVDPSELRQAIDAARKGEG